MVSPLRQNPLNPRAKSWFPAEKPSEASAQGRKLTFSLPYEIYGPNPPHVSTVVVYDPLAQPPDVLLQPPAAAFQPPHQCLPFRCFPGYPVYPSSDHYPQQASDIGGSLMEKKDEQTLLKESNSLKEILGISSGPKVSSRFVPPRLRKGYLEELRGRKRLHRKVWKPKNPDDDVPAAEIVPPASPPKEEFRKNTTVMLKNIPNQYRRDSLMAFLDKKCFELGLSYDFFYLPMDFMRGDNLGFAFVNFTTAYAAMKIKSALEGYKWGQFCIAQGKFTSKKILEITWAKIQGKDALIRHFEHSRFTCDNRDYLPVVISPPSNGSAASVFLEPIGNLQGPCKASRTPRDTRKRSG